MKQSMYTCGLAMGLIFLTAKTSNAQGVAINTDGSQAAASAMLDVKATDKGMLVPRVAATSAVTSPALGLLVYQTGGAAGFYYYNGSAWVYLKNSATPENGTATGQVMVTGAAPFATTLQTMSGDASIAANGALTIANNAVTVAKMATSGTLPAFNGSALTNLNGSNIATGTVPAARLGSGTPTAATFLNGAGAWSTPTTNGNAAGQVMVTGASPFTATLQTMSGDANIAANGAVTIANNAITVAKMATSGTLPAFNGSALTNLNASNISSGTVPVARIGSGSPSANTYLNGNGTWSSPPTPNMKVTTVTSSGTVLDTDNQFVYISSGPSSVISVLLPSSPSTGQMIYFFTSNAYNTINPNGKQFLQGNAYWGTSNFTEIGSTGSRSGILIYNGQYWIPISF